MTHVRNDVETDSTVCGNDDEFDFDQYQEALDEDPTLFDWLDKPKGVMHDVLAENKDTYK